jgi:hypothetical protein
MRTFPIMESKRVKNVPWDMIAPHERTAKDNHGGQTLQRLSERGGLCPLESVAVLEDTAYNKRWPQLFLARAEIDAAKEEAENRLIELLAAYQPAIK